MSVELPMSRTRLRAAVAVAGLAVLLAITLRWESARNVASGRASSCTISATFDCDKVQASEYADLAGLPLSIWGAVGNLILIAWLLASRRDAGMLPAAGFVAAIGFLAAVYLFYVSWFEIGAVCLYCTGMQICSVALAVLVLPPALRAVRRRASARAIAFGGSMAGLLLGLAVAGEAFASQRSELLRLYQQPRGAQMRLDVSDAVVIGNPSTPISGLLYIDFGCPVCLKCSEYADYLVRKYPEDVHFIFKHYPLDRACNPHADSTVHAGACIAARACVAATIKGRGPLALGFLFRQASFFPQTIEKLRKQVGVEKEEWKALMESQRVKDVVMRDIEEHFALGYDPRVPIAYINGRPLDDPNRLVQIVEKLIRP